MHRAAHTLTTLLVFLISAVSTAGAHSADRTRNANAVIGAMHWRCVGPFRGGRTVAVSGVAGTQRFYFGAVGGGVWRSDNAGQTWTPIFDAVPVASIGAVAVAPSDSNVVYVGTGEADFRSDLQQGDGMYRSSDAGHTWEHIGLADTRAIGRISIDPKNANDLVVAALGHPYGANPERGIFRSTDGGHTWRKTLYLDPDTGAIGVTRDPQRPNVLFASLLQTRRPPWSVYAPSKGPGSGLYLSRDGGDTWSAVHGGLPSEELGRIGVSIAPTDSQRVYAVVDAKRGGLYRSNDGGMHWMQIDSDKRLWQRGWYFEEVTVDPHDRDTVYVSNTSLYRSRDGGATFHALKGAPGGDDYHMLWIDPLAPERMILASDQGATVSIDGARTWSSWYNQPTAQLYHVATDNRFPFWMYGAQQDSGAIGLPSRSPRRAITQADWRPLSVGGESDFIAPDPLHPGVVYGSRVVREDLQTHDVRDLTPTLNYLGPWRDTWTLPLVFSAADPHALYFSHQALFRTLDDGRTWQRISPDLTRSAPGVPSNLDAPAAADRDDPHVAPRGVIYTIAPSPLSVQTIWTGTSDGVIALTRDGGTTWTDVTPPAVDTWSKIGILEASHFDAAVAYAAVDRHRLDDLQPYIYKTSDGGRTWTNVVAGIPAGSFVNAIREDPQRRGLLYAGTETGVYVSFDDAASWHSLQLNLPVASVRDLSVRDDALVIATHGRSFWVLDDLAPLRQFEPAISAAPAWLFTPQIAYRISRASDEGTPLPPEIPAGENPPDGAIVDYTLRDAARNVELTILDDRGGVVRHWSSAEPPKAVDERSIEFPTTWLPRPVSIATDAGPHRLVWDLHYTSRMPPTPDEVADPFSAQAPGVWAIPGTYRVRLRVDGHSIERPLIVKLDPRETATANGLAAQFVVARAVEGMRVDVARAVHRFPRNERLPEIASALAQIQSSVESAPGAPSPDAVTAFDRQRTAYARALGPS